MKTLFRNIHLYLSLAAGIVIAIVCFTGAVLVFEKEMLQTLYPERYRVQESGERVPLQQLVARLQQHKPQAQVSGVKIYGDAARTVEVAFTEEGREAGKKGNAGKGEGKNHPAAKGDGSAAEAERGAEKGAGAEGGPKKPEGGRGSVAFMNPYTGELIATSAQKSPFFRSMFELHRWLLVREPGKLLVGVSTVFFLFIILTGLVLWWPKTRKVLRQRLTLKWDAGWKRLNHDLHLVLGFYTAIFLFAFAFTGLAWSFEWFNNGIYSLTNSEKEPPRPPRSAPVPGTAPISFDQAYTQARTQLPGAEFYNLQKPKEDSAAFTVQVMPADAAHERATSQLFLDQYSGRVLGTLAFADKNLGQRVRATFYPVHVGSIGGLPGRIIAFISCIAGFTFPITGLILWLNRLKKDRKRKRRQLQTR
ncbi:MAG: PepSY-associated TM helix domain-containing protein [Adhaeribacter sp.]